MTDNDKPGPRGPILPSIVVAFGGFWFGGYLALNADHPSMLHRFFTSLGALLGVVSLAYFGYRKP